MEGNHCGPVEVISRYLPGRSGEDHDRTVRTAVVQFENRTVHLHYTSPHSYRYTKVLQKKYLSLAWAFTEAEMLQKLRGINLNNKSYEFSTEL